MAKEKLTDSVRRGGFIGGGLWQHHSMSRGVAAFVFAALASTLCASGGAAQRLSDDERREALQLCYSSDEAAQRFCLRRIADLAADDADARRALTHLARQPGPVGDDARVLHRLRYGGDLPTLAPSPTQRSAPAQAPTPPAEGYAPPPPYAPEPYAPQPYAPQPYAPQQYAPQQHAPEPYAPERYAPPVYPSSHRFAPRPRPNDPSRIHLTATGYTLEAEQRFFTFQGPAV
ncbi:MAG: hypothetical protein H5U40_19100, partial [Polyangiaceae bacterium]|nr:hypothetical protein [Polyangiaceae bacterium]